MLMAQTTFQVGYDGDALADGSMDVRELAPALIGLADLAEAAAQEVYGSAVKVRLDAQSTEKGSFIVNLQLIVDALQAGKEFFTSDDYEAAKSVVELIFGGMSVPGAIAGYMWLRKQMAGRTVAETAAVEPPGRDNSIVPVEQAALERVVVRFKDGSEVITTRGAVRLLRNSNATTAAEKLLAPLKHDGVDRFLAGEQLAERDTRKPTLELTSQDAALILSQSAESLETISDTTSERALTIVTPSFKEGVKWRVSDGNVTYLVAMADRAFVERVQAGDVSLNARDILRVKLRVHQYRADQGLKTEYEVTEVLEHIPPRPSGQLGLDFDES